MEIEAGKVLIGAGEIAGRVEALSEEINLAYGTQPVTLVGVLDGCLMFFADLVRRLEMPLEMTLIKIKTYGGSTVPQKDAIVDCEDVAEVSGRHVLVVDDIYDSGRTLAALVEAIRRAGARSVRTCVFLKKESAREREVRVDFVGFTVPDLFVVGYGLDYAGKYRNLPHVAALEGRDEGPAVA